MPKGTTTRDTYKLNKNLGATTTRTISQKAGFPLQAHHLISVSQMAKFSKVAKWARDSGYDINRKSNAIALPAHFGHTRKNKNYQRHNGGHDDIYYAKVRAELQKIKDDIVDAKPCPNAADKKDIMAALAAAERSLRRRLTGRTIWLYNWSEKLYDADYRDEGAGNLIQPYGRQLGYSAGEDWADKYKAGNVRRRYELKKGKAVVRAAWYKRFNYPKPGSAT